MSLDVEPTPPALPVTPAGSVKLNDKMLHEVDVQPALEKLEDDEWENGPDNPRNWPPRRKWTAIVIVNAFQILYQRIQLFFFFLHRYRCTHLCLHWLVQ